MQQMPAQGYGGPPGYGQAPGYGAGTAEGNPPAPAYGQGYAPGYGQGYDQGYAPPPRRRKDSRDVIASSSRSYLLKTTEKNQQVMVGFADRVTHMLPYAFEGFGLLMERGCIAIADDGRIQTVPGKVRKTVTGTDETVSCQKVARIVGKEFARITDRVTVYTTFGIRP
jgi:hypothetical protein